jgi:hypothetical protein
MSENYEETHYTCWSCGYHVNLVNLNGLCHQCEYERKGGTKKPARKCPKCQCDLPESWAGSMCMDCQLKAGGKCQSRMLSKEYVEALQANLERDNKRYGWICPICNRGRSPYYMGCDCHLPKEP